MAKPTLLYDGDCYFCRGWVARWKKLSEGNIDFYAFQEAADRFPEVPREAAAAAVQLIDSGKRFSGAEAVFRVLSHAHIHRPLWAYQKIPFFASLSEACYRLVASHRVFFSKLTRLLWGDHLDSSSFQISSWIFIRMIGLSYFFAFGSLIFQWRGLWSAQGILPASLYLKNIHAHFGSGAYAIAPSLCWIFKSDFFLELLVWGGTLASFLIVLGILEGPLLILCWAFYLSLVSVGQDFLSFQWDVLLLETGLIAAWLLPWRLWSKEKLREPRRIIRLLLLFLLFKLAFESGLVKILSGDLAWRNLSALYYHYQTQPLPTWVGWWAAKCPHWFLRLSVVGVFLIELGSPFLLFFPRRARMLGASAIAFLQILIALTGNYGFFNFLALALCALCFDDFFIRDLLRGKIRLIPADSRSEIPNRARFWALAAFSAFWIFLTGAQLSEMIFSASVPGWINRAESFSSPLHIASGYGPFAVMTRRRFEIVIQGSQDGVTWRDYIFKWKPQDLKTVPAFVEPYQPRLDWQMWFAALKPYRKNSWLTAVFLRLLQGSPAVLGLLKNNPFPGAPPRYVRSLLYDYRFTSFSERRAGGNWWRRDLLGAYSPVLALNR